MMNLFKKVYRWQARAYCQVKCQNMLGLLQPYAQKVYSPSGAADVEKPIETKSSVRETDAKVAGAPIRPMIDATKEEKKNEKAKSRLCASFRDTNGR